MKQRLSSAKSPAKFDFIQSFRQNCALPIVSLLIFFLFYVLMTGAQRREVVTFDDYAYVFFIVDSTFSKILGPLFLLICILATVKAFSFLNSKKQINVYLSGTLNRKQLFHNRAIACLVMFFLSYFIPLTIDLCSNLKIFGGSKGLFSIYILSLLAYFTYSLVGLGIGTIAVFLTGNVVESVLCAGSIAALPLLLLDFFRQSVVQFLYGYVHSGSAMMLPERIYDPSIYRFAYLTPFYLFSPLNTYAFNGGTQYLYAAPLKESNATIPGLEAYGPVLLWLVIGMVLFVFCGSLLRKKKAENAGSMGVNPVSNACITSAVTLGLVSLFLTAVYNKERFQNALLCLTVILIIATVSILLTLALLTRNQRLLKKSIWCLPALLLFLFGSFGILLSGGFGFTSYVPKSEQVEKAYISMPYNLSFYDSVSEKNMSTISAYIGQSAYRSFTGPYTTENDISQLLSLHENLLERDRKQDGTPVMVEYYMKDGTFVSRCFYQPTQEALHSLLSMTESDYAKEYLREVFTMSDDRLDEAPKYYGGNDFCLRQEANEKQRTWVNKTMLSYDAGIATLSSIDYQNTLSLNQVLNKNEFQELKKLIADDLCSMTYQQRYFNDGQPLALLKVALPTEEEDAFYQRDCSETSLPLYSEMKTTISFLNAHGLLQQVTQPAAPRSALLCSAEDLLRVWKDKRQSLPTDLSYSNALLEPFFNTFNKRNQGDQVLSALLTASDDELVQLIEKTDFSYTFFTLFYGGTLITDAAQLDALQTNMTPYYDACRGGYYVLMEFNSNLALFFLPEKSVPGFIKNSI